MAFKKDKEYSPYRKDGAELSDSNYTDPSQKILGSSLNSNPSPLENEGQDFYTVHRGSSGKYNGDFLTVVAKQLCFPS